MKITILGQDPAFSNYGLALVEVDIITKEMTPLWISLIETKKATTKSVRVASDKLARAREITTEVRAAEALCNIIAAEIPTGAQSAAASNALGIALGIVAGHTKPLIEVTAAEVKKAATGYSDASKADMIQWAYDQWPDLQWPKGNGKGSLPIAAKGEHMADALAIVHAAIRTPMFDNLAAAMKALAA
ncbi:MAG: hypothetical protein LPK02_07335 [Rhodobacterales bacterium]|nr:hypothetical protein [Rhodobacterales bacterium]